MQKGAALNYGRRFKSIRDELWSPLQKQAGNICEWRAEDWPEASFALAKFRWPSPPIMQKSR